MFHKYFVPNMSIISCEKLFRIVNSLSYTLFRFNMQKYSQDGNTLTYLVFLNFLKIYWLSKLYTFLLLLHADASKAQNGAITVRVGL